ncbi:larval cuticle protein 4-like [Stomoxys calcitrans]|uniref:larval cuticle protein 4-like n=1 Tax=Stomoxys calcitrans TaxID=35570 RepID=UPI0027E267BE|nr:larval cuticle protein 4-like [Stomoxys calcitrans]
MFKFIALFALLAFALADDGDYHAEVKSWKNDVRHDGFDYNLETSNHIRETASGDEHGNIHGSFEFLSPEGEHIKVSYVADEHGFHPESDVLPKPHPIPEHILKSIEYIKAHPAKQESHH